MAYIYRISNLITHQHYIGLTINYQERWLQHKRALEKNQHCNCKLQYAWNKYGANNFEFQLVKICKDEDRFNEEIKTIQEYDSFVNGYNLTQGGDRGGFEVTCKPVYVYDLAGNYIRSYYSRTEAERQLQCYSIKECCLKTTCRRGFSKIDQQWYQFSYEKQDHIEPYTNTVTKTRGVYALDSDGHILYTFNSVADALSFCGLQRYGGSHLSEKIRKHQKYHDYYWCYIDEYTDSWVPMNINHLSVYTAQGELIGCYPSASEAARQLHLDTSAICKYLRGEKKNYKNLIFKKE